MLQSFLHFIRNRYSSATIVDGATLADEELYQIRMSVDHSGVGGTMAIITCGPTAVTEQYLRIKTQKTATTGQSIEVIRLPEDSTTQEIIAKVAAVTAEQTLYDGVVVQLPLPKHVDTEAVLAAIPLAFDIDGLRSSDIEAPVIYESPVARAIEYIAQKHNVHWSGTRVVILGYGRLVGKPVAAWLRRTHNLEPVIVTVDTDEEQRRQAIKEADIIISGVGQPGLIKADMIQRGVVLFDAGAAESNGQIVGDIDASCKPKAMLITPVPGGIGPIAVSVLLRHLHSAAEVRAHSSQAATNQPR